MIRDQLGALTDQGVRIEGKLDGKANVADVKDLAARETRLEARVAAVERRLREQEALRRAKEQEAREAQEARALEVVEQRSDTERRSVSRFRILGAVFAVMTLFEAPTIFPQLERLIGRIFG